MRNHLLKLSFAVLLGGALAGSACSSSGGTPTGSAGHGGSTAGTAGASGTAGTTGTGGDGTGGSAGGTSRRQRGGVAGGGGGGTGGSGTGGTGGGTVDPVRRDDGTTVPRHADQQDDDRWHRRHANGADGQLPGLPVVDGRVVAARRKASPAKARQALSVVGWSGTVGLVAGGGAAGRGFTGSGEEGDRAGGACRGGKAVAAGRRGR